MTHVSDDLELYALGALPPAEMARITAHLEGCPACRERARTLEEVALALPDTLPEREAPERLRTRILASARADLARPDPAWTARDAARTSWRRLPRWPRPLTVALALLVVVLALADVRMQQRLAAAEAERGQYAAVLEKVSHGGKTWYMAGLDEWAGSGGTLVAPGRPDLKPFVVFHDLRAIPSGSVYALWLVDDTGHWVRAANFVPEGKPMQAVDLDVPVGGYAQCALTVETAREGRRAGPLVMQSRIATR